MGRRLTQVDVVVHVASLLLSRVPWLSAWLWLLVLSSSCPVGQPNQSGGRHDRYGPGLCGSL